MDQAAEPVPGQHLDIRTQNRWIRRPSRRGLLQRPVRPVDVVMVGVLVQDQSQVPFAGDQHPAQALAVGALAIQRSAIAFARAPGQAS
jgi:hypothetical protein